MKTSLLAVSVIAWGAGASPAVAQQIIAPASATIDVSGPGFGSIGNTFDQSGLSTKYTPGVTNFDAYIASNPTHTVSFGGFEWFSNQGSTSAQVTYDFGSILGIDRLALWNEEASGIGLLNLLSSSDGTTFTSLGLFIPQDNPGNAAYPAQVFSFAPTLTRFVQFQMSGCPQANPAGFPACAIGEVAFRSAAVAAAAPEPATWAMMLLGFGVVGGALRRRRKQAVRVRFANA